MTIKTDRKHTNLYDLSECTLSKHEDLTPEQKQEVAREIAHQQKRISKFKQPKSKDHDD